MVLMVKDYAFFRTTVDSYVKSCADGFALLNYFFVQYRELINGMFFPQGMVVPGK